MLLSGRTISLTCAFKTLEGRNIINHVYTYLSNNPCILGSFYWNCFWALFLSFAISVNFLAKLTVTLVQIFYLVGFALFCLESLLSLWVLQVRILRSVLFSSICKDEKKHHLVFLSVAYWRTCWLEQQSNWNIFHALFAVQNFLLNLELTFYRILSLILAQVWASISLSVLIYLALNGTAS